MDIYSSISVQCFLHYSDHVMTEFKFRSQQSKKQLQCATPQTSKIYNVYKIVYKEKQDTLVTITKLKVSPGTCLATYGDSCSICSSKLFRVIKGASWRRLFFFKGKGEPIWHTAKPYLHFRETSSTIFISLYSYRHDASLYGYLVTYPCLQFVTTAVHSTLCFYTRGSMSDKLF